MPSIATTFAAEMRAFKLRLPGDPELLEQQIATARRRAVILSGHGWKFEPREGPRGHYYEGYGPGGRRMMSVQKPDQKEAFVAAINHAFEIQFPNP